MALTVTEIEELRGYLQGVMERADHHAGAVKHIALALAGAILWKKTDDEPIKVMVGRSGETRNVLWVRIGGKRYAFSYNHDAGTIEMRDGSIHGQTLHSFTNTSPLSEIYSIFENL
jgi:hypothetical protein